MLSVWSSGVALEFVPGGHWALVRAVADSVHLVLIIKLESFLLGGVCT